MSVESIPSTDERHPEHESSGATPTSDRVPMAAEAIPAHEAYWTCIHESNRVCPRCFRWRVPPRNAAIGYVEVLGGVKAKVVSADVVEEQTVWPPRVPRAAARRCESDIELSAKRACPPSRAVCECGDIDGNQIDGVRSKSELLELVPRVARRLGDLGYLYDVQLLREMVARLKSTDKYRRRDHDLLEVAVGMAILKARGEDPAAIWDRVDH